MCDMSIAVCEMYSVVVSNEVSDADFLYVQGLFVRRPCVVVRASKFGTVLGLKADKIVYIGAKLVPTTNALARLDELVRQGGPCALSACKQALLLCKDSFNPIDYTIEVEADIPTHELFVPHSITLNPLRYVTASQKWDQDDVDARKAYHTNYAAFCSPHVPYKAQSKVVGEMMARRRAFQVVLTVCERNMAETFLQLKRITYKHVRFVILLATNDELTWMAAKTTARSLARSCVAMRMPAAKVDHILSAVSSRTQWFEHVVVTDSISDDTLQLLNAYHETKEIVALTPTTVSMKAEHFVCSLVGGVEDQPLSAHSIPAAYACYACNNWESKAMQVHQTTKRSVIAPSASFCQAALVQIRDFQALWRVLSEEVASNTDIRRLVALYTRKLSVAFMIGKEAEAEQELAVLVANLSDDGLLNMLAILVTCSQSKSGQEVLYRKVLQKAMVGGATQMTLTFFQRMLTLRLMSLESCQVLVDFATYITEMPGIGLDRVKLARALFAATHHHIQDESISERFAKHLTGVGMDQHDMAQLLDAPNCVPEFVYTIMTTFSPHASSEEALLAARDRVTQNIALLADKYSKKHTLADVIALPVNAFFLAYQGVPSRDLYQAKSSLLRRICPDLNFAFTPGPPNKRVRVCFHANFLSRKHSVYKDRHQVIKHLSLDPRFEVYFTTFDDLKPDVKYTFGSAKHIKLQKDLASCRDRLAALNLDVLVYCEIGMCSLSYYLAHMRLARWQVNTWGHSDTSGIDSIDYYVSSKLYEVDAEEAQQHYSERLVLLDSLCTSYVNPMRAHSVLAFKDRHHFGLPKDAKVVFCAQSLFKMHPRFDECLVQILDRNRDAVLVMLSGQEQRHILSRLDGKGVAARIHMLPAQDHAGYMNLMHVSDIVLDPHPFGGCNSSLEAFSLGKPVVTWPSRMINGRFTAGFYTHMGLEQYVTHSAGEYVAMATRLLQDNEFYGEVSARIKLHAPRLFYDKATLTEWTDFLQGLGAANKIDP